MSRKSTSFWAIAVGMTLASGIATGQVSTGLPNQPPVGQFDASATPPPPDYVGAANWASLPWVRDDGDMTPNGVAESPQLRAEADVFFIHSAVPLRRPVWNADPRDVWFNGDVGQTTTRNQASAFNGCCAIYAPRYRQMNPAAASDAALEIAYSDVARAFAEFRHRVGDRPFILTGHGQGSRIGQMLIERVIDGQPVAARMVAAYLPGHAIPLDWFNARRSVRPCATATDSGCVVSWSIWAEGSKPASAGVLCSNPIDWAAASSARDRHRGAWMRNGLEFPEPLRAPDAGLIAARCGDDGRLKISPPGAPYAAFAGPDGNYRALDIQLVWMDVRQNAIDRVAAFLAARR